jgi:putative transcriptional regulator
MNRDYEGMSAFDVIKTGLNEAIAHARGELTLKTTVRPVPPPPATPAKVISVRKRLKMSQSVFAATLNVSVKLVQGWEQGLRTPDRGELRLIQLLAIQPDLVSGLILDAATSPRSSRKRGSTAKTSTRKRPASAA